VEELWGEDIRIEEAELDTETETPGIINNSGVGTRVWDISKIRTPLSLVEEM
jgi:hypothetical protein